MDRLQAGRCCSKDADGEWRPEGQQAVCLDRNIEIVIEIALHRKRKGADDAHDQKRFQICFPARAPVGRQVRQPAFLATPKEERQTCLRARQAARPRKLNQFSIFEAVIGVAIIGSYDPIMKPSNRQPTRETYTELDEAYAHFNLQLFSGRLPRCVITLNRRKGTYGYFWADTWAEQGGRGVADEIALNPDHFANRSLPRLLSTLVHEMCHLEQHHFGTPGRRGYHNKQWGELMERVGLIPSSTGEKGGRRTGEKMSHYAQPAGPFELACTELIDGGFKISWKALTTDAADTPAAKRRRAARTASAASKARYTCEGCRLNAWAKPGVHLVCGDCGVTMTS